MDEELVVLPLDRPFVAEGRFASLLIHDRELAGNLVEGFEKLWRKAMQDLREIDFHPYDRTVPFRVSIFVPGTLSRTYTIYSRAGPVPKNAISVPKGGLR